MPPMNEQDYARGIAAVMRSVSTKFNLGKLSARDKAELHQAIYHQLERAYILGYDTYATQLIREAEAR